MASRKPHARFLATLAFMGALAGVLIWSKLRLSTNMPRSAYAVPEDEQASTPKPVVDGAAGEDASAPTTESETAVDAPNKGEAKPGDTAENPG